MWALGRIPVLGYTPLMLVITFFGGLTALGLGIVGPVPLAVAAERAATSELHRQVVDRLRRSAPDRRTRNSS